MKSSSRNRPSVVPSATPSQVENTYMYRSRLRNHERPRLRDAIHTKITTGIEPEPEPGKGGIPSTYIRRGVCFLIKPGETQHDTDVSAVALSPNPQSMIPSRRSTEPSIGEISPPSLAHRHRIVSRGIREASVLFHRGATTFLCRIRLSCRRLLERCLLPGFPRVRPKLRILTRPHGDLRMLRSPLPAAVRRATGIRVPGLTEPLGAWLPLIKEALVTGRVARPNLAAAGVSLAWILIISFLS